MGYYTEFALEIRNADGSPVQDIEKIREISKSVYACMFGRKPEEDERFDSFEWLTNHTHKWYSCRDDISGLSEKYSGTVFCLSGIGEHTDDLWRYYAMNGESKYCRGYVVYDDPPAFADFENRLRVKDEIETENEKALRVCEHCLWGIEAHEGTQWKTEIFPDPEDEEASRCDWCEETGFSNMYILD